MKLALSILLLAGAGAAVLVPRLVPRTGPAAPSEAAGLPIDAAWAADALWDDGLAEVARYDAVRTIYGKPRRHELVAITVKEDLDPRLLVKSDDRAALDVRPVLKLNLFQRIETESYPYHFLTSVFVERADPRRFVKETSSSQEWCGNTFQELLAVDGETRLAFHSYWDGEGDGESRFPNPADGILEDGLLVALRAAKLAPGSEARVRLFPSRIDNKVTRHGSPAWTAATIAAVGEEIVETEAGALDTIRFEVRHEGGRTDRYWVEKAPPRIVVRFDQSGLDGRSGTLKNRSRSAYWR